MARAFCLLTVLWTAGGGVAAGADGHLLEVQTGAFSAQFSGGSMVSLTAAEGDIYVRPAGDTPGVRIHRVAGEHVSRRVQGATELVGPAPIVHRHTDFIELEGAAAESTFRIESASGDLVLDQRASSGPSSPGVWGVSWSIGEIPLEYAIVVPGRSGIRLTASMPGRRHEFDYPLGWEAQLVIVQGPGHGFYVWAEDVQGRYKRLVVERNDDGWRLTLITINQAPFDDLVACESVPWHVNVYRGDWRVPARRYRDWMEANFHPVPVDEQNPDWVREIRSMVIMGMNRDMLEALPRRFDPAQTVIYVPSWRSAGYDRDYPVYDQPYEKLGPFVDRAHELGFRVMLHVNYFGVDPLNPLYEKFEPFQVRGAWGTHEKQWWLWTRAEPEIRFAYINPACGAWRDHFTGAMVKLCRDYRIDSLHLDQTLCIFNDHNGLIDGMTMIEGNGALHRQLRQALPEVALSGEGLNEITYRHEAFAQRHAWGLNHADGTWNRRWLELAHPISSYLFRRHTIINGYLGYAPPTAGQIYPAWNEAYEHWGVIPTLKPSLTQFDRPTGFSRQLLDEVAFWQKERLDVDMESDWPADVAFPFHTADGRRAERTTDGRFLSGDRVISHTVTGAARVDTSGTIPGWRAYDGRRLLGLDRSTWYPVFDDPQDRSVFHVTDLPEYVIADGILSWDDLAMVRTRSSTTVVADFVSLLGTAMVGSRPVVGEPVEARGSFTAPDGGQFHTASDFSLAAHPPWKSNVGGVAYARYVIDLPDKGRLRLVTDVAMARDTVGQNHADGVTFGIQITSGEDRMEREIHNDSELAKSLEIDLTAMAGRRATVELTVHPGPNGSPSYDSTIWTRPRIEQDIETEGTVAVAGTAAWDLAIAATGRVSLERSGAGQQVRAMLPGSVFFLRREPELVRLPAELAGLPRRVGYLGYHGADEELSSFVGVRAAESTVGGVARGGLFAHPPDHGGTMAAIALRLPPEPAVFDSFIGIRDGADSTGVIFSVEVNGRLVAQRRMLPGKWERLEADLSQWKGEPIVLSLITDSDGSYTCDWAQWGEPRIVAKP